MIFKSDTPSPASCACDAIGLIRQNDVAPFFTPIHLWRLGRVWLSVGPLWAFQRATGVLWRLLTLADLSQIGYQFRKDWDKQFAKNGNAS